MQGNGNFVVMGARGNKGTFEGRTFDYTRLIVMVPIPVQRGEVAVGSDRLVVDFGKQENFAKFKDRKFPLNVTADYQLTTEGMQFLDVKFEPINQSAKP